MKGYMDKVPVMIIGGTAGNFFGEYMAGGVLILLGINRKRIHRLQAIILAQACTAA